MRLEENSVSNQLIYQYLRVLNKVQNAEECYTACENLFSMMEGSYYDGDCDYQKMICRVIDEKMLPVCHKFLRDCKGVKLRGKLYDLYLEMYALSARRNLKNFAFFYEFFRSKKIWTKTMVALESAFVYADDFISQKIDLMRVSCPPGYGKSYFANLVVANGLGNEPNSSWLRITYSDDLVKITTKQTKAIINSEPFRKVFPWAREYDGDKIFRSDTQFSFCLAPCEDEFNLFAVTRDG